MGPSRAIEDLEDRDKLYAYAQSLGLELDKNIGHGKLLTEVFDEVAEPKLWNPTFITEYPTEVSPLSRMNDDNPEVVELPREAEPAKVNGSGAEPAEAPKRKPRRSAKPKSEEAEPASEEQETPPAGA